jgi:hypothetical protein
MRPRLRSKKMARPGRIGPNRRNWTSHLKNGPDRSHGKSIFPPRPARPPDGVWRIRRCRFGVCTGLGAGADRPAGQARCNRPPRRSAGDANLVAGRPRTPLPPRRDRSARHRQRIASPVVFDWRGLDGVPAIAPLTVRPPLAAGAKESIALPLRHAGTMLCDIGLLGGDRPSRPRALVVQES